MDEVLGVPMRVGTISQCAVPHGFTDKKAVGRLDGWRQDVEHCTIAALGDFFPWSHSGGIRSQSNALGISTASPTIGCRATALAQG